MVVSDASGGSDSKAKVSSPPASPTRDTRPPGATNRAARASVSSEPTKSNTTSAGPPSPVKISSSSPDRNPTSAPELGRPLHLVRVDLADADEHLWQPPEELERELSHASQADEQGPRPFGQPRGGSPDRTERGHRRVRQWRGLDRIELPSDTRCRGCGTSRYSA